MGADAHLQNMQLSISPDPPTLGGDTTIVIEGYVNKGLSGGVANIDVAAGPIKISSLSIPFSSNGVSGTNHIKATLGPFKYPDINVPLIKTVTMHTEIKDQDGEQVTCLDSKLPAFSSGKPGLESPIEDCSDSTYHAKIAHLETDPATPVKGQPLTITAGGSTDKAVTAGVADVNINLSLFKLGLSVPFAVEPGFGVISDAEITVGPFTLPKIPLIPNVKGAIKVVDQDSEPLSCINLDLPVMNEAV